MEKQRLLYQQARLHERGAAEMVLQNLSASRGISQNAACSYIIFLSKAGVFILGSGDPQRVTRGFIEKKWRKKKMYFTNKIKKNLRAVKVNMLGYYLKFLTEFLKSITFHFILLTKTGHVIFYSVNNPIFYSNISNLFLSKQKKLL